MRRPVTPRARTEAARGLAQHALRSGSLRSTSRRQGIRTVGLALALAPLLVRMADGREVVMDSRLVIDFVAPDQEGSAENCKVDWGHYRQHKTNHGTLRQVDPNEPGVWTSAVLNVNNPKVAWTYVYLERAVGS